MSVKLTYNITQWDKLRLNYWGIPKCGNTSVKYGLIQKTDPSKIQQLDNQADDWVHQESRAKYITKQSALDNGYTNFTIIRHPYQRVISLYKDFGLRRSNRKLLPNADQSRVHDLDYFINHVIGKSTDSDNIHIKSMCYFICENNQPLFPNVIDITQMSDFLLQYGVDLVSINTIDKQVQLSEQHKQVIYNRYKQDFDAFNYAR